MSANIDCVRSAPAYAGGRRAETLLWHWAALGLITLALLLPPLATAQRPAKVPQIGVLTVFFSSRPPSDFEASREGLPSLGYVELEAFRQGLRDLGYVEGQSIALEYRHAEGKRERLPALAAELVLLKVDIILATGNAAVQAAQHATETIPIVFPNAFDPVGQGLVASLARPGGHTTGVSFSGPELDGKRLELLKAAVPGVTRVAYLWAHAGPALTRPLQELETAARALGVQLHPVEVRDPYPFDRAFATMAETHADALLTQPSPVFFGRRTELVALAAQHRLAAMYEARGFVEAGGFMAYGVNVPANYRRAATYVDKILKGAKPGDLPVEQPTKFDFVINLKTAQALGLTIPPTVLFLADEVLK